MAKKNITIILEGQNITITKVDDHDYISLTDMVRNHKRPDELIRNGLRTRNTLNFLGAWENLYNPNFKPGEFDGLMRYAGDNSFIMSVKGW